ncbi:fumarylacetoacetate hydrolase family protein [Arthrobacter sp. NPDC089319]|uniref:fumarylacetoacetate hydrolase family protein n=1 Tax=Arthrobacter sp. NPDC089319 TaxID=3155915 RepID=UPI00344267CF
MRIARLQTAVGTRHAVWRDGGWHHVEDPFADVLSFTGDTTPAESAKLLAPVRPAAIVGIGHNDTDHPLPVQAWHKSLHTLANPGDPIRITRGIGTVNVEGELAAVIGKRAAHLTTDNARDHVLGYTVANDVTNADLGQADERLFQAKAGTNYTPLGPWIETDIKDPENVSITVTINGQPKAKSGSFNLPSSVADCLVYVTRWMTLEPGDIVMTGAPGTCADVQPGDRVDITLGGIGTLTNSVV